MSNTIKLTDTQAALLAFLSRSADVPELGAGKASSATYAKLLKLGLLVEIEQWPYHAVTARGRAWLTDHLADQVEARRARMLAEACTSAELEALHDAVRVLAAEVVAGQIPVLRALVDRLAAARQVKRGNGR